MTLFCYDSRLRLARAKSLLVTSLGTQVACVNLVVLLACDGVLAEEFLEAGVLTLGILHLHTCRLNAGVGYGHVGLGGNDAACRSLRAMLCTDEVGLGLRQAQTKFRVLDNSECVALLHVLELCEAHLTDETLHSAVLGHDVLAHAGIVGKLSVAEVHELAYRIGCSAKNANHDEGII